MGKEKRLSIETPTDRNAELPLPDFRLERKGHEPRVFFLGDEHRVPRLRIFTVFLHFFTKSKNTSYICGLHCMVNRGIKAFEHCDPRIVLKYLGRKGGS